MRHIYEQDVTNGHDILPERFSIARLETLSPVELLQFADIHRHKYFELLFLTEGGAVFQVDTNTYPMNAGYLCLVRPGKMHALELAQAPKGDPARPAGNYCPPTKGYRLCFAPEFFHVSLDRSLLLNTSTLCGLAAGYPLEVAGTVKAEMLNMLRIMDREYRDTGLFKAEALRGLLKIFFIYLSRLAEKEPPVKLNRKNQLVEQFLALVDTKFATFRRATDYADALSVTTNYLNETVKTVSGFTTSYHIHQRVILEAKRLAVYSDHSMKQVAFTLGFEDVCHFSRFFKKGSGQGFTEFKQKTLIGVQ
jgi:AraC family transcriptional activator of pobA